jgi:hypothetical protein
MEVVSRTKPKPAKPGRTLDAIADDIVWALGHVDYKALIPEDGSAPGFDIA